ncbi:MAG: hypothetical protein NZM33_04040 [Bryobacteraceae bacterium]|nr:hypothetical protein [Bryobacteraceae bacterium]
MTKRILCLANSRKMQGRCVAGKELINDRPGSWIRPVSARTTGELSFTEICYAGGGEPQVLDIIDVPLLQHCPKHYQQENWLVDPTQRWTMVERFPVERLAELVDPPAPLWIDGYSSLRGKNDRMPVEKANTQTNSLKLVDAMDFEFNLDNYPRIRGCFTLAHDRHSLRVTDPVIEDLGRQSIERLSGRKACYLTISLGEPLRDKKDRNKEYVYKLIAAVIGWT